MKLNIGANYDLWSSKVGFLVWEVWKARNQAVHQRTSPNPTAVIHKAKLMELEFAELEEEPAKHSTSVRRSGSRVTWRPPPAGWIKCNVDAAVVETRSAGATAAVFKDSNGSLLTGINSTIVATSPLAAEALAVREALIMSKKFQMEKVIIESDNQILVQALKSHASIADIQVILDDILYLVKGMPNCGFTWAPREANLLAHEVAKLTGSFLGAVANCIGAVDNNLALQVTGRMVKLCLLHVRITSLSIIYGIDELYTRWEKGIAAREEKCSASLAQ
ncbi:uncharacterized protein LOC107635893 [Arachis ipaensis]|uniref:uncharacterized protein LOC107635893 n=1 Tax=Arachis ipaensis TaxID=130454 RepID=UPI0007AF75C1|nr:uncharacterized protein LOC107635893 [Arachis ipaensis]XP_025647165.1 uncharacterized protein LOC112742135 [Arachis hypogaea]